MQSKWLPNAETLTKRLPDANSVRGRLPNTGLVVRYRRFMYEFEKHRNVQVGLRLFVAGIGLAVLALALFVWSFAFAESFYERVQFAYALSMVAAPLVMCSLVVLLQPGRRALWVAVGGVALTWLATIGFLWVYPYDWYGYGDDYTLSVVATYAIGMAGLTGATGVSLKAHAPQLIQTLSEIRPPRPPQSARAGESADSGGSSSDGADDSDDSAADGQTRVVVNEESRSDTDVADEVALVVNGERYAFGDGETFGRREEPWLQDLVTACGGKEDIPYVSNEHLEFSVEDDGVYVRDLSRNGTSLNGEDLEGEAAKLSDGDTLVLADRAEIDVEL